jgi:cell division protein FtsB
MTDRISPKPTFWTANAKIILGGILTLLAVHDIFGAHGLIAMRRAQGEITQIRTNIDRLNRENTELAAQVDSLKSDPQAIERIAREEMGLARPGEVIIKLPPPDPSAGGDAGH